MTDKRKADYDLEAIEKEIDKQKHGGVSIGDACRKLGYNPGAFYNWIKWNDIEYRGKFRKRGD